MSIRFSVIIPTYNRAALLEKTLQTFITQEYQDFEVIVVDDGGNDGSENVVAQLKDSRFKYYWKENAERGAARNYGVSRATGNYVNFFDSDDLAYPNHLSTAFETINKYNNPDVFYLGFEYVDDQGRLLRKVNSFDDNVVEYAVKKKLISIDALFFKREAVTAVPFIEDRQLAVSEDAVQLCQMAARYQLFFNNTVTSAVVEHSGRSMSTARPEQIVRRRDIVLASLKADPVFMSKYEMYLGDIENEANYLLSLSYLGHGDPKNGSSYFKKYLKGSSVNIFSIRTMVFIKKYFQALLHK